MVYFFVNYGCNTEGVLTQYDGINDLELRSPIPKSPKTMGGRGGSNLTLLFWNIANSMSCFLGAKNIYFLKII